MAAANGAMGLGLEMFEFRLWLIYVAVTVVFEAWWIGRRRGRGWISSLFVSVGANAITALCCPQLVVPFLHTSFVGSQNNPNPFLNAVVLFTVFGVVSASIEAFVWSLGDSRAGGQGSVLTSSLAAHLLGVPIALAILLLPPHPYIGLHSFTNYHRRYTLRSWATGALGERIAVSNTIPNVSSVSEALSLIPPKGDDVPPYPDAWAAAYYFNPSRFATRENRAFPFEWNTSLSEKVINPDGANKWVWLIRPPPEETGYRFDIYVNLATGVISQTREDQPPSSP